MPKNIFVAVLLLLAQAAGAALVDELRLELVGEGLGRSTSVTHAGDERLFVVLQEGRVLVFAGGEVSPEPFLDLRDKIASGGEQGLLGLAFHPDYANNGLFLVTYTNLADDLVVARYAVSTDPNVADPGSEVVVLEVGEPTRSHNGGQLAFGPDGFLYVGVGDGGGGFDPFCQAQDKSTLLGTILRLEVSAGDEPPFATVPPSNPFVGEEMVRPEIWAYGLRNPWRFSFDRQTGDLYVADVGQREREEINFQPAASAGGENYGWKVMEGDLCTGDAAGCTFPLPDCGAPELVPPVLTFDHGDDRCAVIGGYVYRGTAIPELRGTYLYGDFCTGTVWAAKRDEGGAWQTEELVDRVSGLTSFGEDQHGEIYLTAGFKLFRLAGPEPTEPEPTCQADATTLCLLDGRFAVATTWRAPDGQSGAGRGVSITGDSGYFWFFNDANPEVFVKLLDGCFDPFNHFWVFAAGLTNVEVRLEVTDTETGEVRVYDNPLGRAFPPIQDVEAFAACP